MKLQSFLYALFWTEYCVVYLYPVTYVSRWQPDNEDRRSKKSPFVNKTL